MAQPVLAHALRAVAPLVPAILFVYSRHLAAFNFEQVVVNLFKTTRCHFVVVDFHTRGAVETALVGMLAFEGCGEEEPLVFVDNDNVYPASLADILRSGGAPVAAPAAASNGRSSAGKTLAARLELAVRRMTDEVLSTAVRGLEIKIDFDESFCDGSGVYVLASVLERFFRKYVTINSFTETVLTTQQRGEITRWRPESGLGRMI